jgi:hypothetical protein
MEKVEGKRKGTKKRDYGNEYVSVTEVLGGIRKIGLEMWYKSHTKEECDRLSEKAKEIGSQIHELIESYVKGKEGVVKTKYQEEVNNGLKSFIKFRKEHPEIELEWAEQKIINDKFELNGTLDCIGKEKGETVIIDWKTGEAKEKEVPEIYTEYLIQLSGYTALHEGYLCEVRAPRFKFIKKGYVVCLAKDKEGYGIKEVGVEELHRIFTDVFFPLLMYAQGRKKLEKRIKEEKKKVKDNSLSFTSDTKK